MSNISLVNRMNKILFYILSYHLLLEGKVSNSNFNYFGVIPNSPMPADKGQSIIKVNSNQRKTQKLKSYSRVMQRYLRINFTLRSHLAIKFYKFTKIYL